jgi:hypothetical protein
MTYAKSRFILDGVIGKYPEMTKYISRSGKFVQDPLFESAILKIINSKEHELNEEEKAEVNSLLLQHTPSNSTPVVKSLADTLLESFEMDVECKSTKYINLDFILPGTVAAESLFSMVGHMFDDRRQSTSPYRIEEQVFLKVNRNMWNEKSFFKFLDQVDK